MVAKTKANLTMTDLVACSKEELDELYLSATTPAMKELQGLSDGRILAGDSILNNPHFADVMNKASWLIPWKGKVFGPVSELKGKGRNRLEFGLLKLKLFPFESNIVPPLVGKDKVYSLNYDIPGNPKLVRHMRDDIKKIHEGLFLGAAHVKWDGDYKFVLYFALQL